MSLVTGRVIFEQEPSNFAHALLTVKLADVSLADAPSPVIAIQTQSVGVEDINTLTFELTPHEDTPEINPRSTYSVSAHIRR